MNNVKRLQVISLLAGMYFYTPIMTLFLIQRDISVAFLVLAQTMFSVAMMVGELPTGVLADKYGQKVSLQLGLLLDVLGMVQLLFVRNELAIVLFFIIRGISVAFRSGSDEALLYDSHIAETGSTKGYSRAYAKYLSNDILGFIIATAIVGVVVQLIGAAAYVPMIIATGLAVLSALMLSFGLKTAKHVRKAVNDFNSVAHLKSSLKVVKSSRTIFALMVAGLLTLNGEYFLRQTYQPYFQDMAVPALFLGLAISIGKVLNFFAIKYSHLLEKVMTVDQIILFVNVATGLSFAGLALARSPWALVAAFILAMGLFNAERPVISDYVNQQIDSHQRSTVLSAVSFIQNIGTIATRLALAAALGLWGVGATFALQAAYLIIGAFVGVWYLRSCGCVHRVTHAPATESSELEVAQELA